MPIHGTVIDSGKPSVTKGLLFNVSSFDTESYGGAGRYWKCTVSGELGVCTTNKSDTLTANKDPEIIIDPYAGIVFDIRGSNTVYDPPSGWWHWDGGTSTFPHDDEARTYSTWVKLDTVNSCNAFGGQDGNPTWGSGHDTASAFGFVERGDGYEIIGHGYDKKSDWSEGTTGRWLNLVASYDSSDLYFYRNGEYIGTVSCGAFDTAQNNFFIGRGWSKSDLQAMDGQVAHWSIWDRALSAREVNLNFQHMRTRFGV
tara:strand:- start:310 stop:1077 length:768 start_codon:yes stop_codon:yes gene_type:complete